MEPTKPHLSHNVPFLNLWMEDKAFTLDTLNDLPWYVAKDSYQTMFDDKPGYDNILLSEDSRTFFGIQWGGCDFTSHRLPFKWKISPYFHYSTGLVATTFFQIAAPFLEFCGEAATLPPTCYLSSGKYRPTSIIQQVSRPPLSFDQLEFLVLFTWMTDTMDNS